MRQKIFITIILFLSFCAPALAQEFNGKVTVRFDRIQGVDAKVFEELQRGLTDLINNKKWTEDNYKTFEKIDCSFMLNITKRSGNIFSGTLTIQASRAVFNSVYSSPLVNYIDKDITFKYEQSQVVVFDQQRVAGSDAMAANLPAIFAFYANFILGLHYDSFEQGGGTQYFKNAQNIVLNAPEDGKNISGWKANDGNNKTRYWLIDQIFSSRFENFRPYFYTYHRYGLDQMATDAQVGKSTILDGLDILSLINKQNPNAVLIQFFFNAKSGELINIVKSADPSIRGIIASKLAALDVPNASKYNEIK